MEVKQVVAIAKKHLMDVMDDESIELPTLEEVWFEEKKKVWKVTLGVRRRSPSDSAAGRLGLSLLPDYKTVTISKVGDVISLRDRTADRFQ